MADETEPGKPGGSVHTDTVDKGRRRFLISATTVIGAGGAALAALAFVKTWLPSARAEAVSAPVKVALTKVEPGQKIRVGWNKLPIDVINRTPEQLKLMTTQDGRLRDPYSEQAQQPKYVQNPWRSIKPEWFVFVDICTHLGCVPDFHGEAKAEPWDAHWVGGYYCPCHHSRYDLGARVYDGVPAPLNMVVMPYHFIDDMHIEIGVDPPQDEIARLVAANQKAIAEAKQKDHA